MTGYAVAPPTGMAVIARLKYTTRKHLRRTPSEALQTVLIPAMARELAASLIRAAECIEQQSVPKQTS